MQFSAQYWWYVLFGFSGRIPRSTWWVATLGLAQAELCAIYFFINPDIFRLDLEPTPPMAPAETLFALAMLIPGTAVSVKRFNDRNRPYWLGYAIAVFVAFSYVFLHYTGHIESYDSTIGFGLLALTPIFVWLLIDQGFRRGTKGDNRYGPDPLG